MTTHTETHSMEARLDLAYVNGAHAGLNAANKTEEEQADFRASIERTRSDALKDRSPRVAHTETQDMCERLRTEGMMLPQQAATLLEAQSALLTRQQEEIETLFEAIKHGEQDHQDWLEAKIKDHFSCFAALQAKP